MSNSTEPILLSKLRSGAWAEIPSSPGVYWWYFPQAALERFGITKMCNVPQLRLRHSADGRVCLYHGMANNLAQRVEWHAAQKLTQSSLRSGFLSTFRLTLLTLNDFDYSSGEEQIDDFFNGLALGWRTAASREEAKEIESIELLGDFHYPLNIQGNKRTELQPFVRHLKLARAAYKGRHTA